VVEKRENYVRFLKIAENAEKPPYYTSIFSPEKSLKSIWGEMHKKCITASVYICVFSFLKTPPKKYSSNACKNAF